MTATYATPGIYVEEVSTLPPSVVETGTAIPAFIGYTLTKPGTGSEPVCLEVNSLHEYEEHFGKTLPLEGILTKTNSGFSFTIKSGLAASAGSVSPTSSASSASLAGLSGSTTSSGSASSAGSAGSSGSTASAGATAPTGSPASTGSAELTEFSKPDFYLWYAIDHYFRNGGGRCYVISVGSMGSKGINANELKGGIARLEREDEPTLIVIPDANGLVEIEKYDVYQAAIIQAAKLKDRFAILDLDPIDNVGKYDKNQTKNFRNGVSLTESQLSYSATYAPALKSSISYLVNDKLITIEGAKLDDLQNTDTSLYNQAIKFMGTFRLILPPSAAVAGAITSVDGTRGVWKAPANVPLQSVIAPVYNFTDEEQAELNIDNSGKSINIIRSFPGRGNLIWGARTMAGNSNEWRYVSVRRLFAAVEENINKASAFAVFEPNDISTWLKVKGMIDSYLYSLWQRGALQGASAEEAYFVDIGLGKTMTQTDVNEGRMIIVIGLAATRPAEFIIIRFSHKQAA